MAWIFIERRNMLPGILRIARSAEDPGLRPPSAYSIIDYKIEIDDPAAVFKNIYDELSDIEEKDGWFTCSPQYAIPAINRAAIKAKRSASRQVLETQTRLVSSVDKIFPMKNRMIYSYALSIIVVLAGFVSPSWEKLGFISVAACALTSSIAPNFFSYLFPIMLVALFWWQILSML